jgi:hypothetical protein
MEDGINELEADRKNDNIKDMYWHENEFKKIY